MKPISISTLLPFLSAATTVSAGEILWSGLLNESYAVEDFDKWSWSSQTPPYQWYIHGDSETSTYLDVSPDYLNPNSTAHAEDNAQGVRISIDSTSSWNGQTMMRSELIPQIDNTASPTVDLGAGKRFYHFSLSVKEENFPDVSLEHQVGFFESHFTELKYGGSSDSASKLAWYAGGASQWSTDLTAGVWYNFAYAIDFDAGTVALYTSTGGEDLKLVVEAVSADAQSNSQDWHVGQLRLDNGQEGGKEDWYWSGVYVEKGEVTLKV
ncbi:glycoside hydrolase family 131 protein [Aspergillus undulatus]|uniref:glycoside hydrolase family 131 protein n=1 Tax=Aspergillus undulatus TaxID=1810928 RepID=UPI003CCCD9A2